ncbi:hypothetical protein [Enterococcus dongliensis]|uniref:hypothetical protein n=1 Tax=Enterococcus dongliensis TaxID=2559925 RepID=UPI0028920B7B|nr:hypothetical protein [Enterococcus dongliensis]MDT2702978.1 hypothetical protein [Enterococcus dongliensis]
MFLDSRSSLILEELYSYQGRVFIKTISEKYPLNARQIDYSLTKLNDYLEHNGFSRVLKSNGELIAVIVQRFCSYFERKAVESMFLLNLNVW